jgi:hypothetical protein
MYPKCVNGHLLTDENFHVGKGDRKRCRKCSNISSKKWRSKNRTHARKYLKAWRARRRQK